MHEVPIIIIITVRVEHFEVFLISRFSWVVDDAKIIHVEGGINTHEIWQNLELHEIFHPYGTCTLFVLYHYFFVCAGEIALNSGMCLDDALSIVREMVAKKQEETVWEADI